MIVKTSRTFFCSSSGKPHDSELLWTILTTSFHQAYQPLIKITGIRTCSGTSISSFHSRPLCRVGLGTNIGRIKVRRNTLNLVSRLPHNTFSVSFKAALSVSKSKFQMYIPRQDMDKITIVLCAVAILTYPQTLSNVLIPAAG